MTIADDEKPDPRNEVEHFGGLSGASAIPTGQFQMAQFVVKSICRNDAIGVLHGDAGYGKSFAMKHAVAGITDRDVLVTDFPPGVSERHVAGSLLKQLVGVEERGERRVVIDAAAEALWSRRRLIVIDEAQRLSHKIIELLRHYHDNSRAQFTLLLVGGNECWKVLSRYPMLRSRIQHRVEFFRMPLQEVPALVRAFHPVWQGATDDQLIAIDERRCLGVWRNWAKFTGTVLYLSEKMGKEPLDPTLLEFVFSTSA